MSLAALSVFEFANTARRTKLYDIRILSEHGGRSHRRWARQLETVGVRRRAFRHADHRRQYPRRADLARPARVRRRGGESVAPDLLHLHRRLRAGGCRPARTSPRHHALAVHRRIEDALSRECGWRRTASSSSMDRSGPRPATARGSTSRSACWRRTTGPIWRTFVARILVVDLQRSGGQSQHSALLEMNPKSDRIQDALAYARRNLRTPLSVDRLAHEAGARPAAVQPGVSRGNRHLARQGDRAPPARSARG